MSRPNALWDRTDLARAYRDVRGVTESVRRTWGVAFRTALPDAAPRRSLDLGCGTGRFTALLADTFGGAVIGVDASVAMLTERHDAQGGRFAFVASGADALALRGASVDVALLSMVYHFLVPPEPAIGELARVVRRGGAVLVRTPTREIVDRVSFLPFFPGAYAIDQARMPPRDALTEVFTRAGFERARLATIEQEFAATPMEAYEKVRHRAFSTLQLISDEAFATGLRRFEAFCRTAPVTPMNDVLDLFAFVRR